MWPPRADLVVTTSPSRSQPGWDGSILAVLGIASPYGTVVSVPPAALADARDVAAKAGMAGLRGGLGALLGRPADQLRSGTFRWCEVPARLPEEGVWLPTTDPRLPAWLRPYGGRALVAIRDDRVVSGVGVKHHDAFGQELAAFTEPRYRGQGLATSMIAQAARQVLADGAVPTVVHETGAASGHLAGRAGFRDRGWQFLVLLPPAPIS